MSDLISRQDAIIAVRSHRIDINDPKKIVRKSYEDVIRELPSAEPEPQWIPTSKERPPQHQEIWITDVYGDVEVVYRGDGILWHSNGDNGYYFEDEIIAWMPASVPEPYREVKE